ncbi:tetratricopeptide repeat protein [uncultured Winogradskyella sp.]|uniref:tetratricopeptide repeat protein n=1 Tax=uncultured Winogradskyella sp. TaxID=395353 RepID=UPI002608CCCE|nr:tetratricopeptide repeat protein [uncultured Winogradskyella sp.]
MLRIKSFLFVFFTFIALSYAQDSHPINDKLYQLKSELEIAKKSKDSTKIAITYIKLGNFFQQLGLYSEAIKNYQSFQKTYTKKDTSLVNVQNALANINLDLKKYKEAKKHTLASLEISNELNYIKGKANVHALLGSIAEKQKDYKLALTHQNKSLSIFKLLKDSTGLAISNENIGSIYEDLEHYEKAKSYFKKAKRFSNYCNSDIRINIINNLGDVNRKTGNFDKAIRYTNQALKLSKTTKNESQLESALKDLSRTYAELGDYKRAYEYLNNQSVVNEQELKRKNIEVVSTMEVLYEVNKKEAQLQLLNKQNQINKVRQYIILVCTLFIILALTLAFLYWKKRRKHEKRILEYRQQLLQVDLDKKTAEEIALKKEIETKVSSLTNYSLIIAHKNKLLSDVSKTLFKLKDRNINLVKSKLKELIKEIDTDLANHNEWTELMGYFGQIHPEFFENIKQITSVKLSSSEMRLAMLLRLNLSSKEIANILHITPDSVRIARYRLRKKLPINSKDDLQSFLQNL